MSEEKKESESQKVARLLGRPVANEPWKIPEFKPGDPPDDLPEISSPKSTPKSSNARAMQILEYIARNVDQIQEKVRDINLLLNGQPEIKQDYKAYLEPIVSRLKKYTNEKYNLPDGSGKVVSLQQMADVLGVKSAETQALDSKSFWDPIKKEIMRELAPLAGLTLKGENEIILGRRNE